MSLPVLGMGQCSLDMGRCLQRFTCLCLLGKFCLVHSQSMGTDACQYESDWLCEDVLFGGV